MPCRSDCSVKAIGKLPPGLGSMDSLSSLDLQNNSFYSTLPPQWANPGQFPSLQNLLLNSNNLTGSIPWTTPTTTTTPPINNDNATTNSITASSTMNAAIAAPFPQLQLLRLDDNNLSGPLPVDLFLPSLLIFRGFNNHFSGELNSTWLEGSPKMQIVALQQNDLSGELPETWGMKAHSMHGLQELYVSINLLYFIYYTVSNYFLASTPSYICSIYLFLFST